MYGCYLAVFLAVVLVFGVEAVFEVDAAFFLGEAAFLVVVVSALVVFAGDVLAVVNFTPASLAVLLNADLRRAAVRFSKMFFLTAVSIAL